MLNQRNQYSANLTLTKIDIDDDTINGNTVVGDLNVTNDLTVGNNLNVTNDLTVSNLSLIHI